jgi:AraC-like DNA-binding protein
VDNTDTSSPGGEVVLAKLSEVLFVETLRRYIALLPPEQTGWLAGIRDPEVGKALALLHRQPAHPWTIAALASEVGMSRSVLAERFRRYVISPRRPWPTSHAGGFSSPRRCSNPRAVAWRRLPLKLAMSRSHPLTAPSNVSSLSHPPDSAANRNRLAVEPSVRADKTASAIVSSLTSPLQAWMDHSAVRTWQSIASRPPPMTKCPHGLRGLFGQFDEDIGFQREPAASSRDESDIRTFLFHSLAQEDESGL